MSVNEVNHPVEDDVAQGRSEGRGTTDHQEVVEQSSEASSSKDLPSKRFRMRGSKFFLTYPQCGNSKEEVAQRLAELFGSALAGYVVAEERHESGDAHLHVYIALEESREIKDAAYFDSIVHPPKHGNYQVARSPQSVIEYCAKEGCYVAQNVDIRTKSRKRKERTVSEAYFRDVIVENMSKDEADFRYGQYRLLHGRALDAEVEHQLRLRAKRFRATQSQQKVAVIAGNGLSANEDIAEWLNANIRPELPRDLRQAQLWIVTKPGAGKTTFKDTVLPWLYPGLSTYQLPYDGDWFDAYEDGCYDLIIADEYRAQMKIQTMNQLADGSTISLRRRGQPPVIKRDRLPMIVLSNYTPDKAYRKLAERGEESLKALKERFLVVEFTAKQPLRVTKEGSRPPVTLNHPTAPKAGYRGTYAPGPPQDTGPVRYNPYRDKWDDMMSSSGETGPPPH